MFTTEEIEQFGTVGIGVLASHPGVHRFERAEQHIKLETDGVKLVWEDLRKISEVDWRERSGDLGWGEVIRQLVTRSDAIEGELRSFIKKDKRPETGFIPPASPAAKSFDARPPKPDRKKSARAVSRKKK